MIHQDRSSKAKVFELSKNEVSSVPYTSLVIAHALESPYWDELKMRQEARLLYAAEQQEA